MTIDTSTTAGKIAVMQAWEQGKELQARRTDARNWSIPRTKFDPLGQISWNWSEYEYSH